MLLKNVTLKVDESHSLVAYLTPNQVLVHVSTDQVREEPHELLKHKSSEKKTTLNAVRKHNMDRQNMLVQMKVGFATIWALNTLVVVHIANMFPQVGHSKFPVTVRTRLFNFL